MIQCEGQISIMDLLAPVIRTAEIPCLLHEGQTVYKVVRGDVETHTVQKRTWTCGGNNRGYDLDGDVTWNPPYHTDDILYVRETWKKAPNGYYYYEDWQKNDIADITKWKPSIRMPKEAARIWLKVTDVRVERLQEITEAGAEAEGAVNNIGMIHAPDNEYDHIHTAKEHFIEIWNSTIKKSDLDRYGWDANPWVWVIEFERCEKPEGV